MNEENYIYKKLALAILSKALDDICPTFEDLEPNERREAIQDRIRLFEAYERELDREWEDLEKLAEDELEIFKKSRERVFESIRKSDNTEKVQQKIAMLEDKLRKRLSHLTKIENDNLKKFEIIRKNFDESSKKYHQWTRKIEKIKIDQENKRQNAVKRHQTVVSNLLNSINTEKVKAKLEASKEVWERKYKKLKNKFNELENIHENKRFEQDQIRMAIQSFEERIDVISHLCEVCGVNIRDCYETVIRRMKMVGRKSKRIDFLLKEIKEKGDLESLLNS